MRFGALLESAVPSQQGGLRMNNSHTSALQARHAGLDAQIANEARRPSPDQGIIASLKKQKLKIKEALSDL
jgi:hypothetical protein